MIKIIYLSAAILLLSACNDATNNTTIEKPDSTTGKRTNSAADTYTADTLYQALPQLVTDISSSSDMETLLAQNWILEDDKETLQTNSASSSFEMPVRSFDMAKDFTVLKNCRNTMQTGNWKFDAEKKTIAFKYSDGGADSYKIMALAGDELKLTNIGINTQTVLKFVSDGMQHKSLSTDPFTVANNKWRKKPRSSESDAAIQTRLKESINFLVLYYKDIIARRSSVASFYGLPSCMGFGGGVSLTKKEDVDPRWVDCFYNKAQAMKAYDIMDAVMDKKYTLAPIKEANWIKQNLFVLQQMYNNL